MRYQKLLTVRVQEVCGTAVCKLVFHIQFKGNLHVVNLFIQE